MNYNDYIDFGGIYNEILRIFTSIMKDELKNNPTKLRKKILQFISNDNYGMNILTDDCVYNDEEITFVFADIIVGEYEEIGNIVEIVWDIQDEEFISYVDDNTSIKYNINF